MNECFLFRQTAEKYNIFYQKNRAFPSNRSREIPKSLLFHWLKTVFGSLKKIVQDGVYLLVIISTAKLCSIPVAVIQFVNVKCECMESIL